MFNGSFTVENSIIQLKGENSHSLLAFSDNIKYHSAIECKEWFQVEKKQNTEVTTLIKIIFGGYFHLYIFWLKFLFKGFF